ncbi:MAG: FlgO family outer membrane protein [bacterium]
MFGRLKGVLVWGVVLVLSGCMFGKENIKPSDDQIQRMMELEKTQARLMEDQERLKKEMSLELDDNINELVQQITEGMTAQKKTTIAIVDFTDLTGNVSNLGRYLSEELITRLKKTGKFNVIERNLLNKVIEEQKLSLTKLIDPGSAKQLGRILGVDAIVSGTIGDLVKQLKVNARIIGTEKGDVLAVAQTAINKNEAVKKLMEEGVKGASTAQEEAKTTSTPAPTPKKPIQTGEIGGFLFALEECKKSGEVITCDFTVTNKNTDLAWIIIDSNYSQPYVYLYNDLGNSYRANDVTLGTISSLKKYLAPNTSIKLTLRFNDVKQEGKVLPSLTVQIDAGVLTFRNIPLSE